VGVGWAVFGERGKRLAGAGIRIVEDRRGLYFRLPVDRQEVVAKAGKGVTLGAADRLGVVGVTFGKAGAQELDELDVEPVEPDHRLGCLVAVVVPGPGRGYDKIARLHQRALAVDRGIGAVALDDKA